MYASLEKAAYMLRVIVVILALTATLKVGAQDTIFTGNSLTWKAVLQKAKKEKKYIMVDCYTTWCGPCKAMDKNVFPAPEVVDLLKSKFIAIKLQMDSTGKDDAAVKAWSAQAKKTGKQYQVTTYPTYLFFDGTGLLVHKSVGSTDIAGFTALLNQATNPDQQYAALLRKGITYIINDPTRLEHMMQMASTMKDTAIERKLARAYIDRWNQAGTTATQPNAEVVTLVANYISSADKNIFHLFYPDGNIIDSMLQREGFASLIMGKVVMREEINAYLFKNQQPLVKKPNWQEITNRITKKYNYLLAKTQVAAAKRNWYSKVYPDGNSLAQADLEYVDKNFTDLSNKYDRASVNNLLWKDIFMQATNPDLLLKAAAIAHRLLQVDSIQTAGLYNLTSSSIMDTYANLLYKAGKKKEALYWQSKATLVSGGNKELTATLEKMQNGIPTWPSK